MLRSSGGETMHGGQQQLQQQVMESCAGCHLPIVDRFLLNVGDRPWHEDCVQCCVCRCPLNERCFFKEGKLYCRDDFYKNFGTKCAGCSHGISPTALIRRSREKVFHLECFTCLVCRRQLSTGDELFLNDDDTIVCKQDYGHKKLSAEDSAHHLHLQENQVVSLSDGGRPKDVALESRLPAPDVPTSTGNSPTPHAAAAAGAGAEPELKQEMDVSDCESVVSNCSYYSSTPSANNNNTEKENDKAKDGSTGGEMTAGVGAKRRGPRTTIKVKQLETLKAAFAATPKPTRHIREQLARDTGLSMRVIQVWFQNRRSKERRMKQLNVLGARRQFFRSPRRMRSFRPGDHDSIDDSQLMPPNGFPYFPDGVVVAGGDFYHPAFMNYNSYIEQMSVPPPPPHPPPSMSLHEGSFLQASNGTTDRSLAGLDPSVVGGDVSRSQDAACHHFGGPPPPLPPPPPSTPTLHALRMHHSGMMSLHAAPNGPNPFAQQHLDKPWPACL